MNRLNEIKEVTKTKYVEMASWENTCSSSSGYFMNQSVTECVGHSTSNIYVVYC